MTETTCPAILIYLLFGVFQDHLINQPLPGEDPGWVMTHSFCFVLQGPPWGGEDSKEGIPAHRDKVYQSLLQL